MLPTGEAEALRPEERAGLWWHRDFRSLWGGETVSELGSQVSVLAVPLVAVRALHATTFEVGALTAASTVGFVLVGLPAGALVDRLRRRHVMMVADAGRVLAMASVPVAAALHRLTMAQLYVVSLVSGVLTVFFDVAYQSYLPFLVGRDKLVEGNAKLTGSAEVAQVAGPSIAGGLVQAIGGAYAIATDAASFLVSAAALWAIRAREPVPEVPDGGHPRLRRDIGEGLRFVFGHRLLRVIAATTATGNLFGGGMFGAVSIVFLVRVVHASPGVIGALFATGGAGGVLAALISAQIARRIGGARATLAGSLVTGGLLLVPLTTRGAGLGLFAAGYFAFGFGAVLYNVNQVSFRQRLCPERLLGRMNATIRFVVWGTLPVSGLLGGAIGTAIGLRPTLWLAALGGSLSTLFLVASPIRSMRDFPPAPEPGA